jgi:folate-binding protein YgfZ
MNLKNSYMAGFQTQRDFLRVRGGDALRFLQGMWTSDLKMAVSAAPATCSSYLLGIKGRPVSPAQILCLSEKDFVVAVPAGWGEKTRDALDRYLVADDVEISFENAWSAWTLLDDSDLASERIAPRVQIDASKLYRASSVGAGSWLLPLARLSAGHLELWLEAGRLPPQFATLSPSEITSKRIDAGLAEWGKDFSEDSLILEFPFADEISFHKGCYIGQEVVARGSYRGQVPKAFARFQADAPLKEGGFVYRSDDLTKPIAKITSALASRGLGQIRLRDLESATLLADAVAGGHCSILNYNLLHTKVTE